MRVLFDIDHIPPALHDVTESVPLPSVKLRRVLNHANPGARNGQITALNAAITNVDDDILLLDPLHSTISGPEAKLDSFQAGFGASLTPVSAVPDEILSDIFILAVENWRKPSKQALSMSHVCRCWRVVSTGTARLWCKVVVKAPINFPLVGLFATRSRHLRCGVHFRGGQKWRQSSMFIKPELAPLISELHFGCTPSLWALVVSDETASRMRLDHVHFFDGDGPMARRYSLPPFIFQTRTLSIRYYLGLLQGIGKLPNLEKLVLHDLGISQLSVLSALDAPLLTSIELSLISGPSWNPNNPQIALPSTVDTLTLDVGWDDPSVLPWLDEPAIRRLHRLVLAFQLAREDDFSVICRMADQLESLTIIGLDTIDTTWVVQIMGWITAAPPLCLSTLRSLELTQPGYDKPDTWVDEGHDRHLAENALALREMLSSRLAYRGREDHQVAQPSGQRAVGLDGRPGVLNRLSMSPVLVGEHAEWYAERVEEFTLVDHPLVE
ncbi:hypothetical protein DL93DRAFT_2173698 [Clavulina sp. PMI_390]|nr:hypothetical protein DL93DRAFT_2173698 [Clavulina sp. PMI_390]